MLMLILGAFVVFGTSPDWIQDTAVEIGSEVTLGIGNFAVAQEEGSTKSRWLSTCSQSVHQQIAPRLAFAILYITLAWTIFFSTQKVLENKGALLKWFVSSVLALVALFGAGLFANATMDLNSCDLIEVEQ